jgi:endonuclease/exonuclease/phosphatase (EEP) superfamily protein YafD
MIGTGGLVASVLLSLFASFFWIGDVLSHFVFQYIIISAILAIGLLYKKKNGWALVAVCIFAFEAMKLTPYIQSAKKDSDVKYDEVRVLQYNVNRSNKNISEMTRWIIAQTENVDIVVLSEVNDAWEDSLRRIKWAYPYHISHDMRGGRKMAIFSRMYIDEFEIRQLGETDAPAIVLRGETAGYEIPFTLYGIHPPPPVMPSYVQKRNDILRLAAADIANEKETHKLMIADFNTTRFSPIFKKLTKISGLHDSNEGLGLDAFNTTWPSVIRSSFGVAIDNIILSDNIQVTNKWVGPAMGSDHYPVITTLRFLVDK